MQALTSLSHVSHCSVMALVFSRLACAGMQTCHLDATLCSLQVPWVPPRSAIASASLGLGCLSVVDSLTETSALWH